MVTAKISGRWIALTEALTAYARRLGLPETLREEFVSRSMPLQAGILWLSDHGIAVHELPSGLAFDRNEFEAIMRRIEPGPLGDA
jgi:hypothetical protein